MCGILGVVNFKGREVAIDEFAKALALLHHRGPDDEGMVMMRGDSNQVVALGGDDSDPGLGLPHWRSFGNEPTRSILGHRRLSILDLSSAGHQPMARCNGKIWITYNGEIYNYREIREELGSRGVKFSTGTDTEVLLAAYEEWGMDCVKRFVGMFAFGILDLRQDGHGKLILARDHLGIKPLFYAAVGGNFVFGSEIKALLALGASREANARRVHTYLIRGFSSWGDESMFAEIKQLGPGKLLCVDLERNFSSPVPQPYWRPEVVSPISISEADAKAGVRAHFLKNIELHLRSDVSVGAALSGGVDSSAIVGAMRHVQPSVGIHTFCYVAEESALNEERWADIASDSVEAVKHKVHPDAGSFISQIESVIALQDEPFQSTSIYAQYKVFETAKRHGIKVMLDGQGADECLAGYGNFAATHVIGMLARGEMTKAVRFLRSARHAVGGRGFGLLKRAIFRFLPESLAITALRLGGRESMFAALDDEWFKVRQSSYQPSAPIRWNSKALQEELARGLTEISLPALLRYEDRNSMAHSVESRVPFLTPDFVSYVLSLPSDYIVSKDGTSKHVFRESMRGIVPDAILDRKDKLGFPTPENKWLLESHEWIDRVLEKDAAKTIPFLNLTYIRQQFRAMRDGQTHFDERFWRWLNLILWTEKNQVKFV